MTHFLVAILFITGPNAEKVQYVPASSLEKCEERRQEVVQRLLRWQEIAYVSQCVKHVKGYNYLEAK